MTDGPEEWISASEKLLNQVEERVDLPAGELTGPSMSNDNGVIYMTEDERSEEYMWMEDIPNNLQNHC